MPRTYSNIEKVRAELAWVNETPDPNKCGCRNVRCGEEAKCLCADHRLSAAFDFDCICFCEKGAFNFWSVTQRPEAVTTSDETSISLGIVRALVPCPHEQKSIVTKPTNTHFMMVFNSVRIKTARVCHLTGKSSTF
jgi:hypothetical protein